MKDHPNLEAINADRAAMFSRIAASQGGVIGERSKYQQCLISPDRDVDGTRQVTFDSARKPTGAVESWSNIVPANDMVRCQYYVHVYDGPKGHGYIIGARVVWDKKKWKYEEHYGSEDLPKERFGRWIEIVEDDFRGVIDVGL